MHAVASTTDNYCWVSLSKSLSDEISLKSLIKSPSTFYKEHLRRFRRFNKNIHRATERKSLRQSAKAQMFMRG